MSSTPSVAQSNGAPVVQRAVLATYLVFASSGFFVVAATPAASRCAGAKPSPPALLALSASADAPLLSFCASFTKPRSTSMRGAVSSFGTG